MDSQVANNTHTSYFKSTGFKTFQTLLDFNWKINLAELIP